MEGGLESKLSSLPVGQKVELSSDEAGLIAKAVELSALTGGWYDIAGPSPKNWFIQRDWRRINLNKETQAVSFKSDNMQLDLKRISRGYEVDIAMEEIAKAGFTNALVDAGGVKRIAGRDIFTPWNVEVDFGGGPEQLAHRAYSYNLTNIAAATITPDGLCAGLIDPRSKLPVAERLMRSITVLGTDAATATAYALASYTLGPKIGLRFIEEHLEIRGIIVDNGGNLFASGGLGTASAAPPADETQAATTVGGGPDDIRQKQIEEEKDL
jgi:thiamine biosynthesis lipoprotein